jgi:hypothetical protein|eukprot:COSAG06_NODE_143_length_22242_cov_21.978323_12_plen_62_part_00
MLGEERCIEKGTFEYVHPVLHATTTRAFAAAERCPSARTSLDHLAARAVAGAGVSVRERTR